MHMNIEGHNLRRAIETIYTIVYDNGYYDTGTQKADAIKLLQSMYPIGLKEAKELIEAEIADREPQPNNLDRVLSSQGYDTWRRRRYHRLRLNPRQNDAYQWIAQLGRASNGEPHD